MNKEERIYNAILYLGAGGLRTVPELSELAETLFLVESRPVLVEELRKVTANTENTELIERVVSATAQEDRFFEYNLPWASGLRLPAAVLETYPGLRKVSDKLVETVSVTDLLSRCNLYPEKRNILVINIPDMELELLEALSPDQTHYFEEIIVYASKATFHEAENGPSLLIRRCLSLGYERVEDFNIPLPPLLPWQSKISLRLNRAKVLEGNQKDIIRKQKEELDFIRVKLKEVEEENQSLIQNLDLLKVSTQETINSAESERKKALEHSEELKSDLVSSESFNKKLQSAIESLETEKKALQQKLEETEKAKNEFEKQVQVQVFRNQLIDKEMIKAEAQIELIKDILIREKAF